MWSLSESVGLECPPSVLAVKRRSLPWLIMALTLLVIPAQQVRAACTWTWDCTSGDCHQIPLCDSPSDIPPLRPLEIPPVAPPALKPIQPHVFPPPGKRACREAYLCSRNGHCRWKPVCE